MTKAIAWLPLAAVVLMVTAVAFGQAQSSSGAPPQAGGAEDLAKQLANPIASLISVRFENNFDCNTGPERSRSASEAAYAVGSRVLPAAARLRVPFDRHPSLPEGVMPT